jgi:methionine-rich copper-binding protein CopC
VIPSEATGNYAATNHAARRRSATRFLLLTALAMFVGLMFAPARHVLAHAILMSSNPAPNSTVSGEELDIVLHFNSRIDATRSMLILALPGGKTQSLSVLKSATPELMEAKAFHLAAGSYTLRWQVLASDGHISRGEIPFNVRNGK